MEKQKNRAENARGSDKTPPMLLNEVSRLCMSVVHKAHDDRTGAQHSARIILARLAKEDGLTQAELVCASKMTAPSISATLKAMEADGLIIRQKDESDQRAVRVYLTELGRQTEEKNFQIIREADRLAMGGISKEEQAIFVDVLLKMRENLIKELNLKNETE